jgi:hypothetical protein
MDAVSEKKLAKKRASAATESVVRKSAAAQGKRRTKPGPRALVNAPPERCFWVNFGPVLKNLRELRDALADSISDSQFAHHVGSGKNDFASWVERVLDDPACARALRRAKTRVAALRAVEANLAAYGA